MSRLIFLTLLLTITISILPTSATPKSGPKQEPGLKAGISSKEMSPQVIIYYFHRKFRCPSCEVVEGTVSEALDKFFPSEKNKGTVQWRVINIDSLENRHYYDDYNLLTNSLVVVDRLNGQERHFRVLENVWEIYNDRQAVFALVKAVVTACLSGD